MSKSRELTVSCMCGVVTHTFYVPTSSLPLPTHLCSCNISRHISGSLLTSYVNITHGEGFKSPELVHLTAYRSSDTLTRHFCSKCGTHMYLEYHDDGHFEAATGTLKVENTDGIVEYKSHIWIEDTLDGGASVFVPRFNGKALKRYSQEPEKSKEVPLNWHADGGTRQSDTSGKIYAHCHCKGVEFFISPPNDDSKTAKSPYSDLVFPDSTGAAPNPNNDPWWLPGHNRFLAGTCACKSCSRASGFDITFWAFIPAINVTLDAEGLKPYTKSPHWGTIKSYRSSESVTRSFCERCGANVFWEGDGRPTLLDIAVGLLDAPSGVRAEEILSWWPKRVSFQEAALNKELIRNLGEGLANWGESNKETGAVATTTYPVV